MADKPSRALVLYGDGVARSITPSHAHLHSLACRASCGFLSLPHSPPSESEEERIVRELGQLLDASEASLKISQVGEYMDKLEHNRRSGVETISERFMGMRAAVITDNLSLKSFGNKLGCTVLEPSELSINNSTDLRFPIVASELLKLLGFQEGKTLETSQFDLVLFHIGVGEGVVNQVDYINDLVGEVMQLGPPKSDIGARLHLSVVVSYGGLTKEDGSSLSIAIDKPSEHSFLFPQQSYTMKGGSPRENVRDFCPMLLAQWQAAVTRKDMVEIFSFKGFKEDGGNLTIPADRFLHEVAFKLWKAPKYGA